MIWGLGGVRLREGEGGIGRHEHLNTIGDLPCCNLHAICYVLLDKRLAGT